MSGLAVDAAHRHWVFETLGEIMEGRKGPVTVTLDLAGPTEGASIRWYPTPPPTTKPGETP